MNGVGSVRVRETGEGREATFGAPLRQDESKGDRFTSVLSRVAAVLSSVAALSEGEESVTPVFATRALEKDEATPRSDEDLPEEPSGGGVSIILQAAERQIRLLPIHVEPVSENLCGAVGTEVEAVLPVPLPLEEAGGIDAAPTIAPEIHAAKVDAFALAGFLSGGSPTPPAGEPTEPLGADEPSSAAGDVPVVEVDSTPAPGPMAVIAGLGDADGGEPVAVLAVSQIAWRIAPIARAAVAAGDDTGDVAPEPGHYRAAVSPRRVTVISEERHLAPARRLEVPNLMPPTLDPPADGPSDPGEVVPANARPEARERSQHFLRKDDLLPEPIAPEPKPQPMNADTESRRPFGAGSVPDLAPASPAESTATPTGGLTGLPQGALQKIAGSVVEAAAGATIPAAVPAETVALADRSATPAPVRVLTVHVDLREHGTVHVRLAMTGTALSLRLRAEREEVAEQLRQDHARLSETLSAAGYETEIVAIDARKIDLLPPSRNDPAMPAGAGGGGNAEPGTGGDRRPAARQLQTAEQGFGEASPRQDRNTHETRNTPIRGTGALYV